MAVQDIDTIYLGNYTDNEVADTFYNLLSRHSDLFSHTANTNIIRVDNTYDLAFYGRNTDTWNHVRIDVINPADNSVLKSNLYYMGGTNAAATFDVLFYKTANLLYIQFYLGNNPQGGVLCFIQQNQKHYVITTPSSDRYYWNKTYWYIEYDSAVVCIEEGVANYNVKKLANYKLSLRDLFLSNVCVMVATSGDFVQISDFKSSSNITFNTVISANNKNYFAAGTNTLIEIEEE